MLEIGILIIVVLLILLVIGVPVSFAMLLSSTIGLIVGSGMDDLNIIPQRVYSGLNAFTLLAIPFFIMTGVVMNNSGMTDRLFTFIGNLVGRFRGGMGQANVLTSMTFGAISGSAVADASGLGLVEIRAMTKAGYGKSFSASVTAVSSIVAPVIPPSIPLILYGSMTGVSIAQLFIGGVIPGLLMGIAMMIIVYFVSKKRNYGSIIAPPKKVIVDSGIKAIPGMLLPVILLGGIFSGIFTPTEAAIISTVYTIIVGVFVYRELNWQKFVISLRETFDLTVKVIFIIGSAALFGWVITFYGITQALAAFLLNLTESPFIILLILSLVFLILGTFMESIAILTLTIPVVMPIVEQVGIDPLYFGVLMTVMLSLGLITPPMGMVLFPTADIAKVSVASIVKESIPFYIILGIVYILLLLIPGMITILPNVFVWL